MNKINGLVATAALLATPSTLAPSGNPGAPDTGKPTQITHDTEDAVEAALAIPPISDAELCTLIRAIKNVGDPAVAKQYAADCNGVPLDQVTDDMQREVEDNAREHLSAADPNVVALVEQLVREGGSHWPGAMNVLASLGAIAVQLLVVTGGLKIAEMRLSKQSLGEEDHANDNKGTRIRTKRIKRRKIRQRHRPSVVLPQ